ncbi:hypothetical protein [[Limnothrix rosea] IAM M-220]|uniref:hypothetical protein n=1 Tax=[Limnothrix rosea] IAM M-220 TaxID=454133 RepID=UPI00095F75E5|nr:hypothetical protein [[Limnothrix rosea] IAM M-220]OKH19437.1 hypothetical protein NIES208_02685 [[Limnothrix rosea] IAM M-220]
MQRPNDLWQGRSGHWQHRFIQHNILHLGYTAWAGYLSGGRGVVICEVREAIAPTMDWRIDTLDFRQEYVPHRQVAQRSSAFNLTSEQVSILLPAIATYDPTEAIVITIISDCGIEINLIRQTKIPPRDCYHQMQRRWAEFQLGENRSERC